MPRTGNASYMESGRSQVARRHDPKRPPIAGQGQGACGIGSDRAELLVQKTDGTIAQPYYLGP